MLPYFQLTHFSLGPITIQVWGLMVALGIIAATLLMNYLAKKYFLAPAIILDLIIWALISAFIFARLFHVIFYEPLYYLQYPIDVFKIWQGGMSSLGGGFGAILAIYLFAKKRHLNFKELLPYFDVMSLGLWLGWGIGRLGCFLIHDHPGVLSNFFLAVRFPTGARFDLGLLESLLGFLLFTFYFLLFPRLIKIRWGLIAGWSVVAYAVSRFGLDFLRATDLPGADVRYWYLTPAQWGMTAILIALTGAMIYGRFKRLNQDNNKTKKQ